MLWWRLLALGIVAGFVGLVYWTFEPVLPDGGETVGDGGPRPTPAETAGPADPVLVGAGDIAACTQENHEETAKLLDAVVAGAAGEVVVFSAGDNAYEDGTIEEYQQCYEPTWGRHKERIRPVLGNHEYNTGTADGSFQYFGAVLGDPGKGYYSFDLGAWHVIVLNTNGHCEVIACEAGSE
ncbi:MAG: metallophosphoesterase family protein, partial [Acidimicrobiia bacterium]